MPSDTTNGQNLLSTLITHENFTWSCTSSFMSSDYRRLISEAVNTRQQYGLIELSKISTKIKVSFKAPEVSYVGLPIELLVSLLNISHDELSIFHFIFEPCSAESVPFIVHENTHVVNGLKAGKSVTIKLTILPLRSGTLTLDGFRMRSCSSSDSDALSLAHAFQIQILD
jgi:hypothetical protein